jgi:hypothetical protein
MAASPVASGTRSALRLGCSTRQALAPEAVAECICCCGVGKAESNIDLLAFVPAPAAGLQDDAMFFLPSETARACGGMGEAARTINSRSSRSKHLATVRNSYANSSKAALVSSSLVL